MINKFNKWNEIKQKLNIKEFPEFYVNQREIWYTKMGKNIGFEEDGKKEFLRPVLILKKIGNLFLTIALTSKGKENHYFYHKLINPELYKKHEKYKESSYVILSQIKVMDKRRFTQRIGTCSENDFVEIQKKLKKLIF